MAPGLLRRTDPCVSLRVQYVLYYNQVYLGIFCCIVVRKMAFMNVERT